MKSRIWGKSVHCYWPATTLAAALLAAAGSAGAQDCFPPQRFNCTEVGMSSCDNGFNYPGLLQNWEVVQYGGWCGGCTNYDYYHVISECEGSQHDTYGPLCCQIYFSAKAAPPQGSKEVGSALPKSAVSSITLARTCAPPRAPRLSAAGMRPTTARLHLGTGTRVELPTPRSKPQHPRD